MVFKKQLPKRKVDSEVMAGKRIIMVMSKLFSLTTIKMKWKTTSSPKRCSSN